MKHAVCDAVDEGHIARTTSGDKENSKNLPENEWICRKDGQPFPCERIREARRHNAAEASQRQLKPLLNTPDRLTGATR